jgi:hypothetical protein
MQAIMNTIHNSLETRLRDLLSFLGRLNKTFDSVAEEVDNTDLKTAMIAMAVESKQYAKEIRDHLKKSNVEIPPVYANDTWDQIEQCVTEEAVHEKGSEILVLCDCCEKHTRKLYKEVLDEYVPWKNLKSIITYQLYAAECAFMKIRLLNSLRFDKSN